MKYFVADTTAETGIRQADGRQGGTESGRHSPFPPSGYGRRHPRAAGRLVHGLGSDGGARLQPPVWGHRDVDQETELDRLKRSRGELVAACPRLQRLVRQMRLF